MLKFALLILLSYILHYCILLQSTSFKVSAGTIQTPLSPKGIQPWMYYTMKSP